MYWYVQTSMSCCCKRSSFVCWGRIVNPAQKGWLLWIGVWYLHILPGSGWIFAASRCMSFPWRLCWCSCWGRGKISYFWSGRSGTSCSSWFLLSNLDLFDPRDWPQWLIQSVRCRLGTAILSVRASDQMCPVWLPGTARTRRGMWGGSTGLWWKKQRGRRLSLCSI